MKLRKMGIILALLATILLFGGCSSEDSGSTDYQINNAENKIGSFETETLNGDKITNDLFSNNKLTVVNVWATFCGPCIDEMPELEKLESNMPDGVKLITICTDVNGNVETAKEIIKQNNIKSDTLLPSTSMNDAFLSSITAVPTTLIVDMDGVVLDKHIGADSYENYMNLIEQYL